MKSVDNIRKLSITVLLLSMLMFSTMLIITPTVKGSEAIIWTDKADYSPGETVTISGSGFLANTDVTVNIERPDGTTDTVNALTDGVGSFTCTYQLNGITGTYNVTATDGTNIATTTFTDPPTFSITIDTINGVSPPWTSPFTNPIHLAGSASSFNYPGQLSQYQVQVNWGDGTIDDDSTVSFTVSDRDGDGHDDDFSGTWSSSPDHTYATGGTFTITVKLYHQNPPGAESGDAYTTATITIVAAITVTTSPSGLSIVVDSITYTAPQTFNWVAGSTHTIGTTSPQSGGTGIQYVWTSWSDLGAITHTVTAPSTSTTYTAYFTTQYRLIVTSAHDSPNPSVGDHWYDTGTSVTASVTSPADESGGTRYRCTGWTGTGSVPASGTGTSTTFTITAPSSITWNWIAQYRLTVASAHDSPNPSVGDHWYDTGTHIDASVTTPADESGGTRYRCTGYSGSVGSGSGSSVGFDITAPSTLTWNWIAQYRLTMATNFGTTSPSAGDHWYDAGTVLTISATAPSVVTGEQYVWLGWTGIGTTSYSGMLNPATDSVTMNSPITETAAWRHEFRLTMVTNFGTTTPSAGDHWYDAGTVLTISATAPSVVTGEQYVWLGWTGIGTISYSGTANPATDSVTMNSPITETAAWRHEFRLTMVTNFGTTTPSAGQHWYEAGTVLTISATAPSVVAGEQYVWLGWTGIGTISYSGTANPATDSVTMNSPVTETAAWRHEFRLTMATNFGTTSPSAGDHWYVAGTVLTISATSPSVVSGERYVWNGWTGTGTGSYTGTLNPATNLVTMNSPITETASWTHQYYLTVQTFPSGLTPAPTPSSNWFNAGTDVTVTAYSVTGYNFLNWDVDTITVPGNPITVHMGAPHTATAQYGAAPQQLFHLTVRTDPLWLLSSVVRIPGEGDYDPGKIVTLTAPSRSSDRKWLFLYWDIDDTPQPIGQRTIRVTMNADHTVTAHYVPCSSWWRLRITR